MHVGNKVDAVSSVGTPLLVAETPYNRKKRSLIYTLGTGTGRVFARVSSNKYGVGDILE